MRNPFAMVDVLMHYVRRIKEIDEDSNIMVCAAGRAGTYLATMALLLGLNIRIGMEDTVWLYPHQDIKISSNLQTFNKFRQIIESLGREITTADEYRKLLGMNKVEHRPKY